MKIDGKAIAQEIFDKLIKRVEKLKKKNITPKLAVILVGNDPASLAYVRQKDLKAQAIGAKAIVKHLATSIQQLELEKMVEQLNNDKNVHGIIIQRPLPEHIDEEAIDELVVKEKDIDAFLKDSPFVMPLANAVLKILEHVYTQVRGADEIFSVRIMSENGTGKNSRLLRTAEQKNFVSDLSTFTDWLKAKNIVVIGKGKTGGGPTIELLRKMGIEVQIIDSKTKNPNAITQNADIIISTVGKSNILTSDTIKKGVILVGVGMFKGVDGKLHGDYEISDIENKAVFYTPIPGGVGPVNVACLLENLVLAAEKYSHE